MIHLTKLGFVLRSVAISLDNCSLYNWPTVLNIPFLVRDPNIVSPPAVAPIPTISAGIIMKDFASIFKPKFENEQFNYWTNLKNQNWNIFHSLVVMLKYLYQ